jgi:hypothetical protein
MPSNLEIRLQDLEDHICKDQKLLKDYQDALRFEDDPRRKARYEKEIEQLRESANRYQKEYEELKIQTTSETTVQMQNVAMQLQDMNTGINRLFAGQKAIYENINDLRQGLLSHYNESEKNVIAAITDKINQNQIQTISIVLDAIESNKIPEVQMQHLLQSVEQNLIALHQSGKVLTPSQQKLMEVVKAPGLDIKHRLKLAIPIIPSVLEYEAEIELGTGINLDEAWQALVKRFRGE